MSPRFRGGAEDGEGHDRSAEDRERARAEREARRAGRPVREAADERAPVEDEPVAEQVPVEADQAPVEDEPVAAQAPAVAARAPADPVAAQAPGDDQGHQPPERIEPARSAAPPRARAPEPHLEPSAAPAPEPHTPAPRDEPAPAPARAADPPTEAYEPATAEEPAVLVHGRSDEAVGVKRVAASSMASAAGAQGPPRFGAPPRGTPRRRRGPRRVSFVLGLLVIAAAAVFAYLLFQPGKGDGSGRVAVRVPSGAGAGEIGDLLAEKDVVASSFFFSLRARLSGDRSKLRSGSYTLRRDMPYGAALAALTKVPPAAPKLAKLTIPEGPSRREVAPLAAKAGLKGSYLVASRSSTALDPRSYGAPKSATLEGFLFPATYDLKPDATARSLVTQQLRAFKRAFAKIDLKAAKRKNLSRYDVLIIASMVEREAGVEKDRRLIAGVIYNRLKQGMPLGIDATIRYELGNFSSPLKESELRRNTPYNTRTRTGLPPGPIGNPGLASLRAAARPAQNSYLFYVVKPCGNGAHAFSSTDAKFQKDVAAYNRKRAQLGGKDPSRC